MFKAAVQLNSAEARMMVKKDESTFPLKVGSAVSASFGGNYCAARIRTVQRQVKVKVKFGPGLGTHLIPEPKVIIVTGGTLRVGRTVKAEHPIHPKKILLGHIVSVHDSSTYTIEFDDGEFKVLTRPKLRLSKAYVDEGQRSWNHRNSLRRQEKHGSECKEEFLDKVVCVDVGSTGDWFPAAVSTFKGLYKTNWPKEDEFRVRSFVDNFYYNVPKVKVRPFTAKTPRSRAYRSTLRQEFDLALKFLKEKVLPPSWALHLPNPSAETADSEVEQDDDAISEYTASSGSSSESEDEESSSTSSSLENEGSEVSEDLDLDIEEAVASPPDPVVVPEVVDPIITDAEEPTFPVVDQIITDAEEPAVPEVVDPIITDAEEPAVPSSEELKVLEVSLSRLSAEELAQSPRGQMEEPAQERVMEIEPGDWLEVEDVPDAIGDPVYKAKVLQSKVEADVRKYFVHFHGWNKNRDTWVTIDRVRKKLSANDALRHEHGCATPVVQVILEFMRVKGMDPAENFQLRLQRTEIVPARDLTGKETELAPPATPAPGPAPAGPLNNFDTPPAGGQFSAEEIGTLTRDQVASEVVRPRRVLRLARRTVTVAQPPTKPRPVRARAPRRRGGKNMEKLKKSVAEKEREESSTVLAPPPAAPAPLPVVEMTAAAQPVPEADVQAQPMDLESEVEVQDQDDIRQLNDLDVSFPELEEELPISLNSLDMETDLEAILDLEIGNYVSKLSKLPDQDFFKTLETEILGRTKTLETETLEAGTGIPSIELSDADFF